MDFQAHKDFSSFDPGEWNALVTEGISDVPFLRYEYLQAWWETRGGGEWQGARLMLISARESDRLAGIAPLFIAEYDGRTAIMLLGSIEISDYLDLIVRAADLERFLKGLIDFLSADLADAWCAIDWYNLPETSPTLAALQTEAEQRGWSYSQAIYHPTPTIVLPGSFDTYLATVDKKQRHEIRRKLRRLEESGRGARWYLVSDKSTLEFETEAFLKLMEGDSAKAGFLTAPMRAHMHATVQAAFQHGWLWMAFLEIDGRKAAGVLNFDYRNRLWGYNSGVDRAFMEFSPGWVLLAYTLQWASDHGRAEFDFMRGNEEYKYRFGAVNRHVMRAQVSREQG